jgi:UDP-glucose 4-epimerase
VVKGVVSMNKTTRVLVTGAAGHLGSHLTPVLAESGYDVVGLDRVAIPDATDATGVRGIQAELNDADAVREALDGVDIVVHCASIHPWKPYTDEEYWDANVKGTWSFYSQVAAAGIERVVLTSSIAAVGYGVGLVDRWPISEDMGSTPTDLYSLTKHTQEVTARLFAATHNIRTIALRPPAFMPQLSPQAGIAMLGPYSPVEDMVSAHVAAVEVFAGVRTPMRDLELFEAFFTTNALPFTGADVPLMDTPGSVNLALVTRYWPHAVEWLQANGFESGWCPAVYDLSKARDVLGWVPRVDFGVWFAENVTDVAVGIAEVDEGGDDS